MKCLNCGKEPGYNGTESWTETAIGEWICPQCLEIYLDPAARKAFKVGEKVKDKTKAFRGMDTEKKVGASLDDLRDDAGWRLVKMPTPSHYQKKAIADFVGHTAAGLALAVECKSTKKSKWSIAVMPEHQVAYLDDLAKCGGETYVLIDFREAGRWFLVPWPVLRTNRIAHLGDTWLDLCESDPMRFWRRGGVL